MIPGSPPVVAPPQDGVPVPEADRHALIEAAKRRLSGLIHAEEVDLATAATQLAQAEAALRLASIHEARVAERLWRSLAFFAAAAGVILLALASCQVPRIKVEGVVRSEALFFRASDFGVIDLETSTPEFSAVFAAGRDPAAGSGPVPVDVEAVDSGRIAINQISFPRGAELQFTTTPDGVISLRVRCSAGCDTAGVNLTFSGSVRSRVDSAAVRPGPLDLPMGEGENYLEFRLRDSAGVSGTSVIGADSLAFDHSQLRVAGVRELPVSIPTILSGEIRNVTMNGKRQSLGRRDRLAMGRGAFDLRSVRLERGALVTEFTGKPRKVTREGRSLVPSSLEWLWTREPLVILWTIFVSLIATMAAAIRWKTSSV